MTVHTTHSISEKVPPPDKAAQVAGSKDAARTSESGSGSTTELRVYLPIAGLQRQFAAYMATPTRARGYPPKAGDHSLIVEVAPALAVQRILDSALKASPDVEPGILYVERQYGILEVHASNAKAVGQAGAAILAVIGAEAEDQLKPTILYNDIIESVGDQHAVILNRTRDASMLLPGSALLVYEMAPALFAAVAANAAEKAAPNITLVDVQMIGAAGRLYISGDVASVTRARDEITRTLQAVRGR